METVRVEVAAYSHPEKTSYCTRFTKDVRKHNEKLVFNDKGKKFFIQNF
ncbi:MAG: hypothetical protein ACOYVK_10470 [Bacillota bacterium]